MRILITGITGTLGTALTTLLLEDGHEVVGYSRCELKQSQFQKHEKLTMYVGDVRDRDRLIEASRNVDLIFHLSALKRIDSCEENPEECVATNVYGTENVLHAQRINKIPRVVLSSTDKAVYPINIYGMSKATAEKLVRRNPNNVVCRWGNVLGSRGSAIPHFVKTLREGKYLDITDKKCTRYWLPVEDAAIFMWLASQKPVGGLYIPEMKAYPVLKLALMIAKIIGIEPKRINDIGIRAGEKLHEHLRRDDEGGELVSSDNIHWFSAKELEATLRPILEKFV
jgi:UDP-N-acetylglucosamine 4,6-dehydratase